MELTSTTVEITIGYLTRPAVIVSNESTTVEITIGYLTISVSSCTVIYNSRNYYRLLNPIFVFLHNFLSCNHHI